MRVVIPYDAVSSQTESDDAPVVGTAPTLATRNVHGNGFWRGIKVLATKALTVPVQRPYAGQGLIAPAFPFYQPSRVAPDAITVPFIIAENNYSPVSHPQFRYDFSMTEPARASLPQMKLPTQNDSSRRPSGAPFTIPYPLSTAEWPTSAQWLSDMMRGNQV